MSIQSWCTVFLTAPPVTIILLVYLLGGGQDPTARDPDIDLTTVELIAKYGYPAESHTMVTEDGYILTLHRIPFGKKSAEKVNRQPVLIQHGILLSSAEWVVMGPEKGLGYILADAGFDVWLGNSRGNVWSKKHVTLDPSSGKFWNFSWHEMGVYDLPAVIDYILKRTGQEKLSYIGHSMGTTTFFVMASERPGYNKKVNVMISLTPAMYITHCVWPIMKFFADAGEQLEWLSNLLGIHQMFPHTWLTTFIGRHICSDGALTQPICTEIVIRNLSYNQKETNMSTLPLIMGHAPSGAAIRNFLHFGQIINSGEFRKYDYGEEKNLIVYGSRIPPQYDVSKITAPLAIIYCQNDIITDPRSWFSLTIREGSYLYRLKGSVLERETYRQWGYKRTGGPGPRPVGLTCLDLMAMGWEGREDVAKTKEVLPNVVAYMKVKDEEFAHVEFVWGVNANSLVYDDVVKLLRKY